MSDGPITKKYPSTPTAGPRRAKTTRAVRITNAQYKRMKADHWAWPHVTDYCFPSKEWLEDLINTRLKQFSAAAILTAANSKAGK